MSCVRSGWFTRQLYFNLPWNLFWFIMIANLLHQHQHKCLAPGDSKLDHYMKKHWRNIKLKVQINLRRKINTFFVMLERADQWHWNYLGTHDELLMNQWILNVNFTERFYCWTLCCVSHLKFCSEYPIA